MFKLINADDLDLTAYIRPGDTVTWGQATAEPLALIGKLLDQRADIGQVRAFVGMSIANMFRPEHADFIKFISYGAVGTNTPLAAAGALELIPCHFSAVPHLIDSGRLPIDAVFVQLSPPGPDGTHSLGFSNDFLKIAMQRARVVIGEINPHVPWSRLDAPLDESLIDFAIESDIAPAAPDTPAPSPAEVQIAKTIAGVVPDGATLQYGIGSLPAAVLAALSGHRDLGLHSGLITDEAVDLVEAGAITNARKPIHTGVSVSAVGCGSDKLKTFLHDNPAVEMHPSTTTHGAATLAQLTNLVSINSALEVDLYGQVNAEQVGRRYVGAIGGQVDYMHAAATAPGGLAIIAMPAQLGDTGRSRITDTLGGPFVTTARTDVDLVVTEHGIADLRGKTLDERAAALIGIAMLEHQDRLVAAWREHS